MFSWRKESNLEPIADLHSHLIPGIDDGAKTLDGSIDIIGKFIELGYQKIITTPHIHPNYRNSVDVILKGLEQVQQILETENIQMKIEAAAEYFVDDIFFERLKSNKRILTFGKEYVLVESSFVNKPLFFESCLFELMAKGFRPVLAHPERYQFLEEEIDWLYQLKEMGVLFQVTISSFIGSYGEIPKKIAEKLYKKNMIDFLGSDLHRIEQIENLRKGLQQKSVKKLFKSPTLLNGSLI